jgi:hypothetical protein
VGLIVLLVEILIFAVHVVTPPSGIHDHVSVESITAPRRQVPPPQHPE